MSIIYITDKSPLVNTVVNGKFVRVPFDKQDDGSGRIAKITVENVESWNSTCKKLVKLDSGISYVYFVGKSRFDELVKSEIKTEENSLEL